jgi:hypothetical protein
MLPSSFSTNRSALYIRAGLSLGIVLAIILLSSGCDGRREDLDFNDLRLVENVLAQSGHPGFRALEGTKTPQSLNFNDPGWDYGAWCLFNGKYYRTTFWVSSDGKRFVAERYRWSTYEDSKTYNFNKNAPGVLIFVLVGGGVLLLIMMGRSQAKKERDKAAAAALAELQRTNQRNAAQDRLRSECSKCASDSDVTVSEIKNNMESAGKAVKEAEQEFAEGAFAPFWDAVERAATKLAQSDKCIQQIIQNSKTYKAKITALESNPPSFRVDLGVLPDTTRIAAQMRTIVRKAQKDFHFASIYEQRKTNKILIAGFTSLGEALGSLSERLDLSLNNLADALTELAETNQANSENLLTEIHGMKDHMESSSKERREHEEKERAMLDNIQRRKRTNI